MIMDEQIKERLIDIHNRKKQMNLYQEIGLCDQEAYQSKICRVGFQPGRPRKNQYHSVTEFLSAQGKSVFSSHLIEQGISTLQTTVCSLSPNSTVLNVNITHTKNHHQGYIQKNVCSNIWRPCAFQVYLKRLSQQCQMIFPHLHDYYFITVIRKMLLNYCTIFTERMAKFAWSFCFCFWSWK